MQELIDTRSEYHFYPICPPARKALEKYFNDNIPKTTIQTLVCQLIRINIVINLQYLLMNFKKVKEGCRGRALEVAFLDALLTNREMKVQGVDMHGKNPKDYKWDYEEVVTLEGYAIPKDKREGGTLFVICGTYPVIDFVLFTRKKEASNFDCLLSYFIVN